MSESARFNMIEAQIRTNNVTDVRIHAALEDNALDLLYPSAEDELREARQLVGAQLPTECGSSRMFRCRVERRVGRIAQEDGGRRCRG